MDIIKTGGYKIAALEIEEILRTYRGVKDCGVVGIPDEEWGEIVCAALIPLEGTQLDFEDIKTWIKEKLPAYKTPRRYLIMEDLPRNAMGKVMKVVIPEFKGKADGSMIKNLVVELLGK